MKYAQFKDPKWDWSVIIFSEPEAEHSQLVRVSKWAEVEFQPRAAEEMIPAQVEALDKDIAAVTDKFGKALAELKARKAELLSIVDQREPA